MDIKEIISQQYGIPCLPKRTSEAMAYVPFQQFDSPTYSPLQGLESGTMFPVLNKPFYGKKCGEGLDCTNMWNWIKGPWPWENEEDC